MTWEIAAVLFLEFAGFFLFESIFGYLIPAGWFYYRYHRGTAAERDERRIQARIPGRDQIRREIRLSLRTLLIFAAGSVVVYEMVVAGWTNMYWPITAKPLWYAPISFVICVFLFDTYFYWTHRFMHWRPIFKHVHLAHHRSVTPTPWAIFAFSPVEAVLQFLSVALLIVFLPLCPFVLILFLWYDTMVNIAGHNGVELIPRGFSQAPVLRWLNTVTHHDTHHTNVRVNYGSFLNLWDRWMGTFADSKDTHSQPIAATPATADGPDKPERELTPERPRQDRSLVTPTRPENRAAQRGQHAHSSRTAG